MNFSEIKIDLGLLLIRLSFGLTMMLSHGIGKLERLLVGEDPIKFYDFLGLGAEVSLVLAVFAEFLCALMFSLGLFTRMVAVFLVFTMLIAFFMVHQGDPFNLREMSFLYLMAFLFILITGPGRFSVDSLLLKTKK